MSLQQLFFSGRVNGGLYGLLAHCLLQKQLPLVRNPGSGVEIVQEIKKSLFRHAQTWVELLIILQVQPFNQLGGQAAGAQYFDFTQNFIAIDIACQHGFNIHDIRLRHADHQCGSCRIDRLDLVDMDPAHHRHEKGDCDDQPFTEPQLLHIIEQGKLLTCLLRGLALVPGRGRTGVKLLCIHAGLIHNGCSEQALGDADDVAGLNLFLYAQLDFFLPRVIPSNDIHVILFGPVGKSA